MKIFIIGLRRNRNTGEYKQRNNEEIISMMKNKRIGWAESNQPSYKMGAEEQMTGWPSKTTIEYIKILSC